MKTNKGTTIKTHRIKLYPHNLSQVKRYKREEKNEKLASTSKYLKSINKIYLKWNNKKKDTLMIFNFIYQSFVLWMNIIEKIQFTWVCDFCFLKKPEAYMWAYRLVWDAKAEECMRLGLKDSFNVVS